MAVTRAIRQVVLARPQSEGVGATVRRSIGTPSLRHLSPFLMLDHFSVGKGAGFPDHPHRGQETITYMLDGAMDHEDFTGAKGTIYSGELQFMTAGRAIEHSEMPRALPDGRPAVGMQLWVDLPKKLKKCEPRYRDLKADEIPTIKLDDDKVFVKVISGRSHGVDSVKDLAYTPVWYFDITMKPGGKMTQEIPKGFNAFAYTLRGTTHFGANASAKKVEQYHNVVFEVQGDNVVVENKGENDEESQFVLIAGEVLDQPIVQHGPFVVNSKEEVYQSIRDYQTHTNGFERGEGWASEIGKTMVR